MSHSERDYRLLRLVLAAIEQRKQEVDDALWTTKEEPKGHLGSKAKPSPRNPCQVLPLTLEDLGMLAELIRLAASVRFCDVGEA